MISWRWDSEILASCATLSITIPNSSRQVQGPIVLDGLVVKPGSLQAWSMVWRLLEHTGSGAGGSTCQEIIQVQCNATQEKHRKNTWYRLRNRRILGIMRAFKGCKWSLLTVSQSQRFSKSELILLARTFASVLESKIGVSSAYKQGVVNSKQFSKSFMKMRNTREPRRDPWRTPHSAFLWGDKCPCTNHCCCQAA